MNQNYPGGGSRVVKIIAVWVMIAFVVLAAGAGILGGGMDRGSSAPISVIAILFLIALLFFGSPASGSAGCVSCATGEIVAVARPALASIASFLGLCICVFKGRTGKLTIDPSCKGKLSIWIIPEDGSPAFTPATAGTTYDADGYKIGNTIYKIDGSTCVTITCDANGVTTTEACVNLIAGAWGKTAPYPVPPGTFKNEPPAGQPPKPVQ